MSELVTARISAHAARLGLHQLAASAPALIQRAHDAQLGYADWTPTGFVDTIRNGTMVYEERTGSGTGP